MPSTSPENNLQNEDENTFQEDIPQDMWEKATQVSNLHIQFSFLNLVVCSMLQL